MNSSLTILDFHKALSSFPDSSRLIDQQGTLVSSPLEKSSAKKDSQAFEENKIVTKNLLNALINHFGKTIALFALPSAEVEMRAQEGTSLSSLSLKKIVRKAAIMKAVLELFQSSLPLSENPSPEACQAYLNTFATYAKQEAMEAIEDPNDNGNPIGLTASITDGLITSLFNITPATALEDLGNYIMTHPTAIATAAAAAIGTEPHPISMGAFAITTLIMNSTMTAAVAITASEASSSTDG